MPLHPCKQMSDTQTSTLTARSVLGRAVVAFEELSSLITEACVWRMPASFHFCPTYACVSRLNLSCVFLSGKRSISR